MSRATMTTNPEFLQKLLDEDPSSKIVCQVNTMSHIDYLNLQTRRMEQVFSTFPEVLLVIRTYNGKRRALYTFLVDGPRIGGPYELTRVVHVAIPPNETHQGLVCMFQVMKGLNPHWPLIKVFLVDPDFTENAAIREVFPSAEVVLSVSHVCAHIQKQIRELFLPNKAENILLNALKSTMCSPKEKNLQGMQRILKRFVDPRFHPLLKEDWLLTDRMWSLHCWRSWDECSQYFKMVETLTRTLNLLFKMSPCLKKMMNSFIFYLLEQTEGKDLPEPRTCSTEEFALMKCKEETSTKATEEHPMEPEAAALMCEALNDICSPAAFGLCQNELEVAQKSVGLVSNHKDKICVQIFEYPNKVSGGKLKTCTCGFYQSTELPCRHIFSLLHAKEEIIQPGMLPKLWKKQNRGSSSVPPLPPDTLEILKGEKSKVSEKHLLVNSLTSQISGLLADCSEEMFQRRYNTLRELADAWIGPYEQVKI
ncbi:hypothetical protein GDO81_012890 [Engystomops pustulosus]|uniref:SWIM-type domain-containing protein n=1 Tax=Engystomops pustulosus TaxID=76066 RepID=A0AAV7AXN7_ENGPU|nr:hypothetical protein GDO81_012890 [Engystomops pustulosus]